MRPAGLAAGAIVFAVAVGFAGCGDDGGETTVTEVVTVPEIERSGDPDAAPRSRPSSPRVPLDSYSAGLYSADVPRGWTLEADEEDKSEYVESRWRNPNDANTSILIDTVQGETQTAAEKADSVRAATRQTAGYREISFEPVQVGGLDGMRWVFEVSGDRRVDYFLNDCGVGVAVLGSTSPSQFGAMNRTFSRVARSVRVNCEATAPPPDDPLPPEDPPPDDGGGCLPEYPEVCVPDDGLDYDCPEVDGSDFSVPGDDPMGFDRDGDGIGCES